jgi:2,3-dihydroxybenzoate decarboxylase
LVISGVFEKCRNLRSSSAISAKESFLLWRIDQSLSRSNSGTPFKDTFRRNFYVTTSGNFSDTALTASITEMGIDRSMFSVDWPFISNKMATDWLNASALSAADKAKVFSGNDKSLLKL